MAYYMYLEMALLTYTIIKIDKLFFSLIYFFLEIIFNNSVNENMPIILSFNVFVSIQV